jgi:hypothetical protein
VIFVFSHGKEKNNGTALYKAFLPAPRFFLPKPVPSFSLPFICEKSKREGSGRGENMPYATCICF